ncbi:MAG: hypothetical protein HWE10_05875 [Gammaproteobacteria bacterium]|nr:hypothetical protein [Gammaproteobacteria bacterium]
MKPFVPGQTFKNNKYYVFDRHGVTVMKPWPEMLAYRKTRTKGWKAIRPKFSFSDNDIPNTINRSDCYRCYLNDLYEQEYKHECKPNPLVEYLETIPFDILHLIKGVGSRQWHLLAMFARCGKEAIELFKSTPALAWMLASSWAFKEKPVKDHFRSIRRLFKKGKSQVDILKWLDYPSSKQVIKLLRKVDMADVDVTFFLHLKTIILKQTSIKTLRHIQRIDYSIVRLLAVQPYEYTFEFLNRYQTYERKEHYRIKNVIKEVAKEERFNHAFNTNSLNMIMELIQAEPDNVTVMPTNNHRVFPWPEFDLPESFPEIEYIDTEDLLFDVSSKMHNCLSTHAESAYVNGINFFFLRGNEDVVFSITGTPVYCLWIVNEIKGICNEEPSAEAMNTIEKWLEELNRINPDKSFNKLLNEEWEAHRNDPN